MKGNVCKMVSHVVIESDAEVSPKQVLFENQIIEKWFTTKEAAEYLRVSPASLQNMASNGKVTVYKLDRRNRFLESDLKRLLLANRRGV